MIFKTNRNPFDGRQIKKWCSSKSKFLKWHYFNQDNEGKIVETNNNDKKCCSQTQKKN